MCLVAIAWKTHPRWRLVLAGNRDEFHARPTAALAPWADRPGVLAGRDLRSGGSWAGVGPHGRMAVVTNVRDPRLAAPPGAPSRGALVADCLAGPTSAAEAADALHARAAAFAPFNLLLADAADCRYVGNWPGPQARTVPPGVHGVSNGPFDAPWPKTRRLCAALAGWLDGPAEDPAALWAALADRSLAPDDQLPDTGIDLDLERRLSAAFIADPRYGTRASTLIALDHAGRGWIAERRFGPDGVFVGEIRLEI
ncbi:NRDE family protein [Pseudoxanthomonas winnipegensis]|uniref:NRDE family protein n=1 Tax=Pseudoxanthomonas winnipegensis TaxID=2480810 RepID=UPI00102DD99C|nr:NRDE family protein [Pseudoxanthomonas winnipegensis]TAA10103.1 NRDE family protein [Pseudoxanthomonas winnipegensis]